MGKLSDSGKVRDMGSYTSTKDTPLIKVNGPQGWRQCIKCWRTTLDESGFCWVHR